MRARNAVYSDLVFVSLQWQWWCRLNWIPMAEKKNGGIINYIIIGSDRWNNKKKKKKSMISGALNRNHSLSLSIDPSMILMCYILTFEPIHFLTSFENLFFSHSFVISVRLKWRIAFIYKVNSNMVMLMMRTITMMMMMMLIRTSILNDQRNVMCSLHRYN